MTIAIVEAVADIKPKIIAKSTLSDFLAINDTKVTIPQIPTIAIPVAKVIKAPSFLKINLAFNVYVVK